MLDTVLQSRRPSGSGETDFGRALTIYGCGGILCHVTQIN